MERRTHPRIELKAFGFNHQCVVRDIPFAVTDPQKWGVEVTLIDISPGGARLRATQSLPGDIAEMAPVALDPRFVFTPEFPSLLHGVVRWLHGNELGLQFVQELHYGASDLQELLGK